MRSVPHSFIAQLAECFPVFPGSFRVIESRPEQLAAIGVQSEEDPLGKSLTAELLTYV